MSKQNKSFYGYLSLSGVVLALSLVAGTWVMGAGPDPAGKLISDSENDAIQRFQTLRKKSAEWQNLTAKKIGQLKFNQTPTAEAVKVVADKLGLELETAPGIEGTVTYNKDGTLGDFLRNGLNPRYWNLSLEQNKLILKPNVGSVGGTVSSERGLYYETHSDELVESAKKCGALTNYKEKVSIDGAGAVNIHGRIWFIDKIEKELKIE